MTDLALATEPDNGRERLLQAGLELFGQKGFAATSVTELCDRAGVSRGLIRFHFGSKQALADAVEDLAFADMDRVVTVNAQRYAREGFEATIRDMGFEYGSRDVTVYVRRSLMEPTARNLRFFARFFEHQRSMIESAVSVDAGRSTDTRWLTMMKIFVDFGPLMLAPQIEAVFGASINQEPVKSGLLDIYMRFMAGLWDVDKLANVWATENLPKAPPRDGL